MSTSFVLTSKTRFDTFNDTVSIDDAVEYEIDCTPWAEDNDEITSVDWNVEFGQVSISNEAVTDNVVSALLTFTQSGKLLVSILLNTASGQAKKIWLELNAKDRQRMSDDYGFVV